MRLLLIEDDTIQRELLSMLLAAVAPDIITAATLEDALKVAAPDVVLTDLHLPDAEGGAVISALRQFAPHARVLGMSATAPDTATRALLDGFLLKPFTPAEFSAALIATSPQNEAESLDGDKFSRLAKMLPGAKLHELYEMSFADAEQRLDRMVVAAADNDLTRYTAEAHALKGSAGMLGATELYTLASSMEAAMLDAAGAVAGTSAMDEFRAALDRLRRILAAHP